MIAPNNHDLPVNYLDACALTQKNRGTCLWTTTDPLRHASLLYLSARRDTWTEPYVFEILAFAEPRRKDQVILSVDV